MGNQQSTTAEATSIFDFTVETNNAPESVSLSKYKGKKAYIIVNVACQCGLTNSNYAALQEIYDKFNPDLEILAFPCNNFGSQVGHALSTFFFINLIIPLTCLSPPHTPLFLSAGAWIQQADRRVRREKERHVSYFREARMREWKQDTPSVPDVTEVCG